MERELDILFQDQAAAGHNPQSTYRAADAEAFLELAASLNVSAPVLLLGAHIHRAVARPLSDGKRARYVDMVACLVVAAKFTDGIVKEDVQELLEHTKVTAAELLKAEVQICSKVNWQLYCPNPITFLRCFSHDADGWNRQTRSFAKVLLIGLTLHPVACSRFLPSTQASAALYLAKGMLKMGTWTKQHESVCRIKEADLLECAKDMLEAARCASRICPDLFSEQHLRVIARGRREVLAPNRA